MNHSIMFILFCLLQTVLCSPTNSQRWGYGVLASFGVSLLGFLVSFIIIIVRKFSKSTNTQTVMKTLIGFAVGALLGDAFIHLIPHSFSSHEHSHENEEETNENRILQDTVDQELTDVDHEEENEEDISNEFLTSMLLLLGVLSFFFIEKSMIALQDYAMNQKISPENNQNYELTNQDNENKNTSNSSQDIDDRLKLIQNQHFEKIKTLSINEQLFKMNSWKYKPTLGYLNLVSDFLHNIMDGLALGVIFATAEEDNFSSTIATLIAIIIHETAQEIGDTSILLENKFTDAQALLSNGLVNCSALIGCFIGLGISSIDNENLVLSFVAGNFIYISCVDMIPELLKETNFKQSFFQLLSFCCAVAIMYGIAIYEHNEE